MRRTGRKTETVEESHTKRRAKTGRGTETIEGFQTTTKVEKRNLSKTIEPTKQRAPLQREGKGVRGPESTSARLATSGEACGCGKNTADRGGENALAGSRSKGSGALNHSAENIVGFETPSGHRVRGQREGERLGRQRRS